MPTLSQPVNWTYLLHGINTPDKGSDTVCQLAEYIAPYSSILNHSYGCIGPVGAVFKNKRIAKRLHNLTKADNEGSSFAIGHSNGCAIILNAMRQGAQFKRIVLINPALKVNTVFPPGDYEVLVIYTDNDVATRAARFFDGLPVLGWFVPDAWGAMGAKGYKGTDPRVRNEDMTAVLDGHSDIFDHDNMLFAGDIVADFLYEVN